MASSSQPRILVYKAGAAISKGMAVKFDTSDDHVIKCSAATDKVIGVAQVAADAAEDLVEVAIPGGGAKGLAGDTVTRGDLLTSDGNGKLIATTTANDKLVGKAMASASANDLFAIEVIAGNY